MKRRRIIMALCAILVCGFLTWCVYLHSPEYFLGEMAVPYEEEARNFYEDHYDELSQLANALPLLEEKQWYYYTFQVPYFCSTDIPEEVEQILAGLEATTDRRYTFCLLDDWIDIFFENSTHLIVKLLYDADDNSEYYGPESRERHYIPLDENWTICSEYVIRS